MWQKKFEQFGGEEFTVVGLALDAEGVGPAKEYYDKFGVTFPSLVDPNYATKFGAVPKTFFVDEFGVVMSVRGWEAKLPQLGPLKPVSEEIRLQFSDSHSRLGAAAVAALARDNASASNDLTIAVQLASRYNQLGLHAEAFRIVKTAVTGIDLQNAAIANDGSAALLSQAYLQLSRSCVDDRNLQVKYATTSFYLNPTIGFGKQIARIISPEKFDGRPDGSFDNEFREGTLRRLKTQRDEWLKAVQQP